MPQILYRTFMFVPASQQALANQLSTVLDPVGGEETFSLGLSATGAGPATWYVANPPFAQSEWAAAVSQLIPLVAGSIWYRCDLSGRLVDTNKADSAAIAGQAWTFAQALAELGLQVISGG